ncbi:unnamed protein product [Musa acuminata subsp. malaccensis]|uniref:(wild Malaysian banana) hypothetical protein n=1 Tax=Musa acuminata subsp. malaccensis TaxID=214687 RepID=A0A804KQA8_MUSAM|nr:unnamed protein product [Musa acuminata subsp. malaccensis]
MIPRESMRASRLLETSERGGRENRSERSSMLPECGDEGSEDKESEGDEGNAQQGLALVTLIPFLAVELLRVLLRNGAAVAPKIRSDCVSRPSGRLAEVSRTELPRSPSSFSSLSVGVSYGFFLTFH